MLTWANLAAFSELATPIFVFDAERSRLLWANEAARGLWRAGSIPELLTRDFSRMSEVSRLRLEGVMEGLRKGEKITRDWTLHPVNGEPVPCVMTMSAIVLEDGRIASVHEAQPIANRLVTPALLRGIEVVRHTAAKVSLHTMNGGAVMRNPAATHAFGPVDEAATADDLAINLGDAAEAEHARQAISGGKSHQVSLPLSTRQGVRWHDIDVRGVPDPVTGETMLLVSAQDVTEERFVEQMLATENRLMQMIAANTPLDQFAHELVSAIEQFSSDALCALSLLNPAGTRLKLAAAPSLPPAFRDAIDSLAVGPHAGSGGAAAYHGRPIEVVDIANDPIWENQRVLALANGLRASWATPIKASSGAVLGTLAVYYRESRAPDEAALRVIGAMRDIAGIAIERFSASEALKQSEHYLRLVINTVPALIAYVDRDERYRFANKTFQRWFRRDDTEIHGAFVKDVLGAQLYDMVKPHVDQALTGNSVTYERRQPIENAAARDLEVSYVPDVGRGGEVRGFVALMTDITARKADEDRLHFLARHDQLTGLPNRALFTEHLNFALTQAARNGAKVAILFLDLDRFKNVNDTLGHPVGDRLLQGVGKRFRSGMREGDTVARLGGDEFTVLISAFRDVQNLAHIAQKLLDVLTLPFHITGNELYVTASIGVSVFPEDAHDAATLIKNADIAMYRAKDAGKNTYAFFSARATNERLEHLRLETSLRRALEHNEFAVHYQPKIGLDSGRIVGAEALLRWSHPQLGMVAPSEFIPLAEETGLIVDIGEWVIKSVCTQVKTWQTAGLSPGSASVNLSALQFRQLDLASTIGRILDETRLDAHSLELELTESSVMANADDTVATLQHLKKMGVQLAIDDFGTGYSSLSYLKRFPIDALKIDQSFVRDIKSDVGNGDAAITEAVIAMALSLRMRVIAEGVETSEQLAFLRKRHCHQAQGFLFSRALPAEQFERLLAVNTTYPMGV